MTDRNIWLSSDRHLYHENVLKFTDDEGNKIRPFDTIDQMHECILDNHNDTVKPGDIYYDLGDVLMMCERAKTEFPKFWAKFNGRKRLIPGNHDDIKWLAAGGFFQKVQLWRCMPEFDIIMSHIPLHESSLRRKPDGSTMLNVHGHIHHNNSPPGRYVNVSVEKTDYRPVNIESLHELWLEQQKVHENV